MAADYSLRSCPCRAVCSSCWVSAAVILSLLVDQLIKGSMAQTLTWSFSASKKSIRWNIIKKSWRPHISGLVLAVVAVPPSRPRAFWVSGVSQHRLPHIVLSQSAPPSLYWTLLNMPIMLDQATHRWSFPQSLILRLTRALIYTVRLNEYTLHSCVCSCSYYFISSFMIISFFKSWSFM